jgi:hypothetical protein
MAEQLRRHCTLSRLFGHLALYVTSSIWSCSNDFNIKLLLFETRIGTLIIAWSGRSLLDTFAGRQIFSIEINGWLT